MMKKVTAFMIAGCMLFSGLVIMLPNSTAAGPVNRDYGGLTLNSPWTATHWNDVWDLTQGDLTLSYDIDMRGLHQPGTWNTYDGSTSYTEVGLRGEGAGDFNPGPWNVYQGACGGWMVSDDDTWNDGDGFTEMRNPDPDSIADLDDKHALQASGGRGERDYDVLLSDPDTVLSPTIGSWDNYGIWFDRDGVDPWQDNDPLTPAPGGSSVPWSQQDGRKTYDTGGLYHIEILYHAIDANGNGDKTDDGLGVMFATVNGVPTGFYTRWHEGAPDYYPAGLRFKGDMEHMQVFAGLWAPNPSYGPILLSNIHVNGYLGTSDPLVADFTYNPSPVLAGDTVQFTDSSHGGMGPYTYSWKFGDGTTSTEQNPTHQYSTAGTYVVKLTVTPFRCVPQTVTRTISVNEWGEVKAVKYYDVNANGALDSSDSPIEGWWIKVFDSSGSLAADGYTDSNGEVAFKLALGTYSIQEVMPTETCWMGTSPKIIDVSLNEQGETKTVEFLNLCLGPGGGLTPGYWSNKNGQATMNDGNTMGPELQMLRDLNLRNRDGSAFDPTTYKQFQTWLLKREATNMAYQLSASLAAMELNVEAQKVSATALIYAPGTTSANTAGFATIGDIMTEANVELGLHGSTPAKSLYRAYQERLYKVLDAANNNLNFVQDEPCSITYFSG